jgi:hypothetical protein
LHRTYRSRGVQALIVDVTETPAMAESWARRHKFSFPVLLDPDGKATSQYAPPDALPDLPRDQVPIASNLIIAARKIASAFSTPQARRQAGRSPGSPGRAAGQQAMIATLLLVLIAADPDGPPAVVTVEAKAVSLAVGERGVLEVVATIREGFRIQANPASRPFLVPAHLELEPTARLELGPPEYPPGKAHRLRGTTEDLSVYEAGGDPGSVKAGAGEGRSARRSRRGGPAAVPGRNERVTSARRVRSRSGPSPRGSRRRLTAVGPAHPYMLFLPANLWE